MKVVIVLQHRFELWSAPEWLPHRLRQEFPGIEVVYLHTYQELGDQLHDADVAITWSLRPEQFRAAPKLRWVHSTAAAVHQLLFPELIESAVILTNAREVHGPVVAEHALALIFALAKKVPAAVRLQGRHIWGQEELWRESPPPRELAGATLGIVGLGSIGRELAKRSAALGMRVSATREHPKKGSEGLDLVAIYAPEQLHEMLTASDYVVIAAPLTADTRGLINAERLSQMKPDAFLINVSRGQLVDEAALIECLHENRIAGAALDVFEREPLPSDSPLWDMKNLLITPHVAAVTEKMWDRHYALISENLRRFLAGKPLLGVVDKKKGY
jgi:phosphoglycerate dehydrogenase-like enzyme